MIPYKTRYPHPFSFNTKMAAEGEPPEITALRSNLTSITDTVTVGGNLQWFANRLVEKAFITQRAVQEILGSATTPANKAGQLIDSVFVAIRRSNRKRQWFEEFVSIFSADTAYAELVTKLQHCVADQHTGDISNQPADFQPPTISNLQAATTTTAQPSPMAPSVPLPTQPIWWRSWGKLKQWFNSFFSTPESHELSSADSSASDTGSEDSPVPNTTSSSPPIQPPPSSHHPSTPSFWSLEKVKATNQELEEMFGNLHADVDTELSEKESQNEMFFRRFRSNLLLLPVRKATLHVKFFNANEDEILVAKNTTKILAILCRFVDYRNYEILYYIVVRFCSFPLQENMIKFRKILEEFETATTVDVYLSAIPDEVDGEIMNGFSEMVVKIDKSSSQCTLFEVRKLNKAIIEKSTLCSHSVYIGAVSRNCVVVRLRFPSSAVGWVLAAITPDFMTSHRITDVTLDGRQLYLTPDSTYTPASPATGSEESPAPTTISYLPPPIPPDQPSTPVPSSRARDSEHTSAPSSTATSSSPPQIQPDQPPSHHLSTPSFWSLEKVKATIEELKKMFGSLHAKVGKELSHEEHQNEDFLWEFRSRLLLLPVCKATLHVKFFNAIENEILAAKNTTKILAILCRYVDYRNFEILYYIVVKFCSIPLQENMLKFRIMLEEFETATTVEVYLSAIPDEVDEKLMNCFSEMVVKIDKPSAQCTLFEVRKLNKAIIEKSTLCSHSVYIGAVF